MLSRKIFSFIIIFSSLFLISCSKKGEREKDVIEIIDNDYLTVSIDNPSHENLIIDTLINNSSIKFISLETTSKSLFGYVDRIFDVGSSYIIYDKQLQYILEFKKNGDFVRKIGNKGRGPLEYFDAYSLRYNAHSNSLILMDINSKFIEYDLTSGEALKSFRFDNFKVDNFYPVQEKNYLLYNNFRMYDEPQNDTLYRFAYLKGNDILYRSLPYPYVSNKTVHPFATDNMFYKYKNDFCFFELFNSVVYTVTEKGLKPRFKIIYESINNSYNNIDEEVQNYVSSKNEKGLVRLEILIESDKYLFLEFTKVERNKNPRSGYKRYALFDKKNKKCLGNSINSFFIQELLLEVFLQQLDDQLLCAEIPARIIRVHQKVIRENLDVKEWTPLMKKLMALEVEEEDNPVLMLMKVR